MNKLRKNCEICGTKTLFAYQVSKEKIDIDNLSKDNFQVTNKEYGYAVETVICSKCRLVQPRYILDYKDIVKLYENVKDEEYLGSASSRGESNYLQVINLIKKFNVKAKTVLEIGAGSGTMLSYLSRDFDVEGIEPNEDFCKYAKENYDLNIHNLAFEDYEGGSFDVIVALDVIEHVVSPKEFILKVHKLLNVDGIVIIGTPDLDSLSHKILKQKWYHIRPPHLFYFNQLNMRKLIEMNKMSLLSVRNFTWNLSLSYLLDSIQKLFFRKSLITIPFKRVKVKINLFDSKVYIITNSSP